MTTHESTRQLNAMRLLAKLSVGDRLSGRGQIMIVTRIEDKRIYGWNEYPLLKFGKKCEISVEYSMFTNPHYCDNIYVL